MAFRPSHVGPLPAFDATQRRADDPPFNCLVWIYAEEFYVLRSLRLCVALIDPHARRTWIATIPLATLSALLEACGAVAVFALIKLIGGPGVAPLQVPILSTLFTWLPWREPRSQVIAATLVVAGLYVAKNGVLAAQTWVTARATSSSWSALSRRVFHAYLCAPLAFHLRRNSSDLLHNTLDATDLVFRMVVSTSVAMASEVLVVGAIVAVLLLTAPGTTIIAVAILLSLMALLLRGTRSVLNRWGTVEQQMRRAALQTLQQTFEGFKEVKLRGREHFFVDIFSSYQARLVRVRERFTVLSTLARLAVESSFIAGILAVVMLVTLSAHGGTDVVPVLGVYAYAGFRIIPSVNRILMYITNVRYGLPAVEKLVADLQECAPYFLPLSAAPSEPPVEFADSLAVDDVSYTYDGAPAPVLRQVSLAIRRGESIGIVGPTGAGKSTLVNLLLGLLSPTQGRVSVDGIDIHQRLRSWQRKVGYVPQSVFLIDDTLGRNIAFGLPDHEIDPQKLAAAVQMAQLQPFVAALPERLNTIIGERGVRLSGGERQRVAIARALYHEPELLVFDEATSALDNQTERELTRAIDALHGRKTLVIIAHRLSTVRACDRLVFLRSGRIAGIGPYDELASTNADFRAMAEASASRQVS